MAKKVTKEIVIKSKGLDTPLISVNKLNEGLGEVQKSLTELATSMKNISSVVGNSFKGAIEATEKLADSTDKLQKSTKKTQQGATEMLNGTDAVVANLKEGFAQLNFAGIESLDTFLDSTVEVRDKAINAFNAIGAVLENFGPWGRAASFGLQLLAPVMADYIAETYEAYVTSNKLGLAFEALEDKSKELDKELKKAEGLRLQQTLQSQDLVQKKKLLYEINAQIEANDALEESKFSLNRAVGEEIAKVDDLFASLKDITTSQNERKVTIEEINSAYGDYLPKLLTEKSTLLEIASAYDIVRAAMIKNAVQERVLAVSTEALNQMITKGVRIAELRNKIMKAGNISASQAAAMESVKNKAELADLQKQVRELEESRDKEVASLQEAGVALANVLNISTSVYNLSGKQYTADRDRTAELQKQYDLVRNMAKEQTESQKTDFDKSVENGDLAAAERARTRYIKERAEQRRAESAKLGKEGAKAQKVIDEQEQKIRDAEQTYQNALDNVQSSVTNITKNQNFGMMLQGKLTSLNANLFEGLDVTGWTKGNGLVTVVKDKMGNQTEEAGRIFWDAVNKFRDDLTGDVQWDKVQAAISEKGISSIFTTLWVKESTKLGNVEMAAGKVIDKQKAILERLGAESLKGYDEETKKNADEMQRKIDEARAARNKAMKDEEAKNKIDAINMMKSLGYEFTYEQYLESVTTKINQDTESFKDNLTKQLKSFGEIAGDIKLDFESDNLFPDITDLNLASKGFNPDEIKQLTDFMSSTNDAWVLLRKEQEKIIADAPAGYTAAALESFSKRSEKLIKDLQNEYDYTELVLNEQMRRLNELRDKKYYEGTSEEQAIYQQEVEQTVSLLQDLWALEDKIAAGTFLDELGRIEQSGGDISGYMREFLNKRLAIAQKRKGEIRDINKKPGSGDEGWTPGKVVEAIDYTVNQMRDISNGYFDYLDALSQATLAKFQESLANTEEALSDARSRLSELESDLEGKISGRRDAVLAAIDLEKQRAEDLANTKIQLERKILAEQEKAAKRRKAIAIAEATINGALAIMQIWAAPNAFPFPFGQIAKGISTAAMAATTALQIATISATPYAEGGYTGQGTERDSTGHKVAGVVHDGEWVAPKWMVNSPKFANTIASLESARTGRFAEGGATSPETLAGISSALDPNTNLSRQMEALTKASIALSNRPVIADVKEFSNVQSASYKRMRTNTIG